METLTRKQRQIREREAQILAVARRMLASDGYLKLNMDRIAESIEYSKGTVYHHFRNKEDIIVALDVDARETKAQLFQMASRFQGRPRHRMAAVGVASILSNRLHPDHSEIQRITCNPAILDKASETRQVRRKQIENVCMSVMADIVRDALTAEDLCLSEGVAPEDLVFGLWAMSCGAHEIMAAGVPLVERGVANPLFSLWHNFNMLLDGYGWKPLTCDEDYGEIRRRAWQERFAPYYAAFKPDWSGMGSATA